MADSVLQQRRQTRVAADFLVADEREREGHRWLGVGRSERPNREQHRGDLALHVGRAAPVDAVVDALAQGIDRPRARVERYRIQMAVVQQRPLAVTFEGH